MRQEWKASRSEVGFPGQVRGGASWLSEGAWPESLAPQRSFRAEVRTSGADSAAVTEHSPRQGVQRDPVRRGAGVGSSEGQWYSQPRLSSGFQPG